MPDTHFSNYLLLPLPPRGRPHGHTQLVRPHGHTLPPRVGTRGSPLALVQTKRFLERLSQFCQVLRLHNVFREEIICTTGDRVQDRSIAEIGGKVRRGECTASLLALAGLRMMKATCQRMWRRR